VKCLCPSNEGQSRFVPTADSFRISLVAFSRPTFSEYGCTQITVHMYSARAKLVTIAPMRCSRIFFGLVWLLCFRNCSIFFVYRQTLLNCFVVYYLSPYSGDLINLPPEVFNTQALNPEQQLRVACGMMRNGTRYVQITDPQLYLCTIPPCRGEVVVLAKVAHHDRDARWRHGPWSLTCLSNQVPLECRTMRLLFFFFFISQYIVA
jgi:hypothetical protein